MQGCPLSMLIYAFYNANLIDIVKGKFELSTGFVDDCAFVAVVDTLDEAHKTLWNGLTVGSIGCTLTTPLSRSLNSRLLISLELPMTLLPPLLLSTETTWMALGHNTPSPQLITTNT